MRNAVDAGSELRFINYRETTPLRADRSMTRRTAAGPAWSCGSTSSTPRCGPHTSPAGSPRLILLAASGRRLDDALATELAREPHVALLSGRYEGIDERVREHLADDAISIGPYVLSGGELAAMVVADAVIRKLPGALGHADSAREESRPQALEGAPEYPHYTRPATYRGWGARGAAVGRSRAGPRVAIEQSRRLGGAADPGADRTAARLGSA